MRELILRFIAVMREERAIYSELLSLSENKKDAITAKNTDELDKIVKQEQTAIMKLEKAEKVRLSCIETFSRETGKENVTMLSFAEFAEPDKEIEIKNLHDELSFLLNKIAQKNTDNRILLESRIEYVRFATDVLSGDANQGIYASTGDDVYYGKNNNSLIDREV